MLNARRQARPSVSAKGTNGYDITVALEASGKLALEGTLSELGPNARFDGLATASADSLTSFIATLIGLAGQPVPALPPLLAGKFSFDGSIEASQTDFAAKDFKMVLAESSGAGVLSVKLKPALVVDGKLVMPKLDLDKVLAELSQPAAPAKPAASAQPAAPVAPVKTAAAPPPGKSASILDGVNAKLSLDVGEITYNKQAIRNVGVALEAKNGVVAVPRLSATLPGDMVLQAKSTMAGDPARPTVSGDFNLQGPELRETKWLDVDVHRCRRTSSRNGPRGHMASSNGSVR